MAIITSSIGTFGRDYSTIASWAASIPADVVASGNSYVGELYNDSEFTLSSDPIGTVHTCDATHTITLRPAAGHGFKDHSTAATNPLIYDASKGVGLRTTSAFIFNVGSYVIFDGLQIKSNQSSYTAYVIQLQSNAQVNNSIIFRDTGGPYWVMLLDGSASITNVAIIYNGTSSPIIRTHLGNPLLTNCTIARTSNNSAANNLETWYSSGTYGNCAIFGQGGADLPSGSTYVNCATDYASARSGVTGSLTYADQFEVTTASGADFRLKSGSSLIDAGTTSGAPSTDIIGQTRVSPDIGAWENIAGFVTNYLNLSVVSTESLFFSKLLNKQLSAMSTESIVLSKINKKTVSADTVLSVAIARSINKLLSIISTGASSMPRLVKKPVFITSTGSVAVLKSISKTLSIIATGTADIAKSAIVGIQYVTLAVISAGTSSLKKGVIKSILITSTVSVAVFKSIRKTLSVIATETIDIAKSVIVGIQYVTLAVISTGTSSLKKVVIKPVLIISTGSVAVLKLIRKTVVVISNSAVEMLKAAFLNINYKTIAAVSTGTVGLTKSVKKQILATSSGILEFIRYVSGPFLSIKVKNTVINLAMVKNTSIDLPGIKNTDINLKADD